MISMGWVQSMRPQILKTVGYGISCVSVALLGIAAYPGAEKAGLLPALFTGAAAYIAGMALRWSSYEVEKRQKRGPALIHKPSAAVEARAQRRTADAS
jgi:hypothetical protein